jgi:uncharacterized protein YdaU (DUF1376 family)
MNYYQINWGDIQKFAQLITPMQELAYRRLLDWVHGMEGGLPMDQAELCNMARADAQDVDYVLQRFFYVKEGRWRNEMADANIIGFARNSARGMLAANARWGGQAVRNNIHNTKDNIGQPVDNSKGGDDVEATTKFLLDHGLTEAQAAAWIEYRQLKKAPVTVKSLSTILVEANKAGLPLSHVLEQVRVKGWRSFKHTWLVEEGKAAKPAESYEAMIKRKAAKFEMTARPGESWQEFGARVASKVAESERTT